MKVLIITHSSPNGLNQKQAVECMNILGSNNSFCIEIDPQCVVDDQLDPPDRIIMIVPEWNGSFPYTFKKLIDDSGYPSWLKDKSILLIGTSNTTFGNVMGTSHLKHILEYVGANVYRKVVSIPHINEKFANNNIIVDERLQQTLLEFCS